MPTMPRDNLDGFKVRDTSGFWSVLMLRDIFPNCFGYLFFDAFIDFSIQAKDHSSENVSLGITPKKTAKCFGVIDQSLASSPIQHHSVAFASAKSH